MSTRLVIEVEQDSADFDQLEHFAMEIIDRINDIKDSGIRVQAATMTDEFGCLVTRFEPGRTLFAQLDGTVKVMKHPAK